MAGVDRGASDGKPEVRLVPDEALRSVKADIDEVKERTRR